MVKGLELLRRLWEGRIRKLIGVGRAGGPKEWQKTERLRRIIRHVVRHQCEGLTLAAVIVGQKWSPSNDFV